jgi:hypothetical protein
MPTRRLLLAALLAVPFVVAGCKINTINYFPPKYANVRVINVMADVPAVNVAQGDAVVWSGVAFEAAGAYQDFENTTNTFTVSLPGATTSLGSASYALAGEVPYTLVPYGTLSAPQLLMLPDAAITPGSGRFQMRFANVAPGTGGIDVYVTVPGASIDNLAANFYNIAYGSATGYAGYNAGSYQIRITPFNTKTVIYDSGPLTFADQATTDVLLYSKGSGTLVNALRADVYGQTAVANSTQARLKAVNAAVQTGTVNQLVDGTALVSGLAYAAASAYGAASTGAHTIAFEATATPGAIIASVAKNLGAGTDASVFVTGFAGSQTAVVLADSNLPPLPGNVRVRFVNASPDTPALDVLVNGTKRVSALASSSASGYLELTAGTYTLSFADPTTGTPSLTLAGTVLTAGQVSTVYAVGAAGGLSGLVTQDD